MSQTSSKTAWRIHEWCNAVGCGRTKAHELIAEGRIDSVKLGRSRLITTSPTDFIASLAAAHAAACTR